MCALNLCPGVWMCGYIVKVCGSKSRGVRAIGNVNAKSVLQGARPFRVWHVPSIMCLYICVHTVIAIIYNSKPIS
jgi:hypothetical protein